MSYVGEITVKPDPFIFGIVKTWPVDAEWSQVDELGFPVDGGLEDIIGDFIEDYLSL